MGAFTFKWPHAGKEVYVTGTFDDWKQTEKLEKVGDGFEKVVTLPDDSAKIYYKFVVDGDWTTDHAAPKEADEHGNENNVLKPEDIVKSAPPETAFISSVSPGATTVGLAKDVPLEKEEEKKENEESAPATAAMSAVPGSFPETPAAELDKQIKISPLPASEGAGNPITLAPGEKIPESVKAQDVNSHVKLDKESYEKADAYPGFSSDLPPVTGNMIPESSLPIVGANDITISSVGPGATTLAMAGEAPLEPKAPAIVKESQEKAGFDPEASAISEEIKEKQEVESELLKKVSEAPATTSGTDQGLEKSEHDKTLAESVTAAAGAAVASAVAAKDTVVAQATMAAAQLPDSVKQALPASVQSAIAPAAKEEVRQEVSPEVPAAVKESIKEAGESPEAAANTAAVEEKKEVESELLQEVKAVPSTDEATSTAKKAEDTVKSATNGKEAESNTVHPAAATTASAKETGKGPEAPTTPSKQPEKSSSTKGADSPATTEKKKKNRLSAMLGKLKGKIGHSSTK